jgi:ubiquitin-protein ligase
METNNKFAQTVLAKQLSELMKSDDIGASVGLENEDDLFLWSIIFEGPTDTLYEGGFFKATLKFP